MSLGRPISEFGQHTCPKCGAVQESPGSTICEQCGQDLTLAGVNKPSSGRPVTTLKTQPKQSPRIGLFDAPLQLLRRVFWTLQSLVSLIWRLISLTLRTAMVLLVLGALVVGLSYVPEVRARVPVMKEVPQTAKRVLRRAGVMGFRMLAGFARSRSEVQPTPRTSQGRTPQQQRKPQPAAIAQKPALAPRPSAPQPLTIMSTPTGATVLLNARQVGKTPLTLKVTPGTYKVQVSRQGYASVTRSITVKAGKAVSVNVKLVAARRPPRRTAPAPVPPPRPPHGREP